MASISTDSNGNRRIFFMLGGKRQKIHLGDVSLSRAESFKGRLQAILEDKALDRRHDDDLLSWIRNIDNTLHKKLAAKGIVPPRQDVRATTLGGWLDTYIALRSDVKGGTAITYGHVRRSLIAYFGAGKPLADISPGDADAWRITLTNGEGLGENTANRRCSIAKQFFRAAVRKRLISENPFADMKSLGVRANKERFYFISRADSQKVIDSCPDAQWKLLFALSRFGGLRCPSEHLALRWGDVNWELGRMTIRSSKTEHHAGKAQRVIPIFPELRPYLDKVWDEPGESEFVITRYRDPNSNLRTQLERIIAKAGLTPWPKLFQNLRSTRQTELAEQFPSHVVCAWIGNSEDIAREHYLQVTDAHFETARAQNGADHSESDRTKGD